jgi:2-C-methyl-D-erythritol 4-phosphate cytidylyltransferase
MSLLSEAFSQEYTSAFTDDASVVESAGNSIHLVEGNRENVKITTPEDLRWAEWMISLL